MHACVRLLPVVVAVLYLVAALPATVVSAKGPVAVITVSGPGLTAPIEMKSAAVLSDFDPWRRQFIAWDRGVPPAAPQGPSYAITFYRFHRDESGASPIYVFDYVPNVPDGPGYIYIPGPDDSRYSLNAGTVVGATSSDRWNPDGKWQYATDEWDATVLQELRTHGVDLSAGGAAGEGSQGGGTVSRSGFSPRFFFPMLGVLALVTAGAAYALGSDRRSRVGSWFTH